MSPFLEIVIFYMAMYSIIGHVVIGLFLIIDLIRKVRMKHMIMCALDKAAQKDGYKNFVDMMEKITSADRCPICNSLEVEVDNPRTLYECGSSDYDRTPNTFRQSVECMKREMDQKTQKPTK